MSLNIEYIALILNSILIPIALAGFKVVRDYTKSICNRLTEIEHKLKMDHHGTFD